MSIEDNFDIESIHIDIRKPKSFNILNPNCIFIERVKYDETVTNKNNLSFKGNLKFLISQF